jgi:metallo-beta-lactamase family protein
MSGAKMRPSIKLRQRKRRRNDSMRNAMKITFAGAADTVTGSRHLVEVGDQRILLDCGLFQGFKTLRERNWSAFPVPPGEIDAVVLSHAHLDHSGFLPVLCREGFRGPIYCTAPTRDLAEVMLLDSAHLLQEEAHYANRHGFSKHSPARPLYEVNDVRRTMKLFRPIDWGKTMRIGRVDAVFSRAGHLLGAATARLSFQKKSLVFSGDLGRQRDLLMPPPSIVSGADVLIVESTYGNRAHSAQDASEALARIVCETAARGGMVLMPSFAVGRAQALLLCLGRLLREGRIPKIPVFLDSPMAMQATAIYKRHANELRIGAEDLRALLSCAKNVATPEQSKRISQLQYPAVIVAGSGMATGGRILHHLKAHAGNPRNHIVFPGFQVPGTRGAKLLAGDRSVKIHGGYVDVNAEVSQIESLSGHADADEIMSWLRRFRKPPHQVFVVHGERDASDALRMRIRDELGWPANAVEHMQHVLV